MRASTVFSKVETCHVTIAPKRFCLPIILRDPAGFIGVQLARSLGAGQIITSTTGAANVAFAKSLGADKVFDYKVEDIFDAGALADNSVE